MSNDGRLIAMTTVNWLNREAEGDLAETTLVELGRPNSTDLWYRRKPGPFDSDRRLIWRSSSGGTPAPASVTNVLDHALNES